MLPNHGEAQPALKREQTFFFFFSNLTALLAAASYNYRCHGSFDQ